MSLAAVVHLLVMALIIAILGALAVALINVLPIDARVKSITRTLILVIVALLILLRVLAFLPALAPP